MVASPMIRYDGVDHGVLQRERDHGLGPAARCASARANASRARRGDGRVPRRPDAARDRRRRPGRADRRTRASATSPQREFTSICDLCWKMFDRVADDAAPDPLIGAISTVLVEVDEHAERRACSSSSTLAYPAVSATLGADLDEPARARALSRLPDDDARRRALGGGADGGGARARARARARRRGRGRTSSRTSSITRRRRPATTSGCSRTSRRSAATRRGALRRIPSARRRDARRRPVLLAAPPAPGLAARAHGRDRGLLAARSASPTGCRSSPATRADGVPRRPPPRAARHPAQARALRDDRRAAAAARARDADRASAGCTRCRPRSTSSTRSSRGASAAEAVREPASA